MSNPESAAKGPEMDCDTCQTLIAQGRPDGGPVHCRRCHSTWTGNEAQHCTRCHTTFSSLHAADAHRYRRLPNGVNEDRCVAPDPAAGWREKRPGVWTNADPWAGLAAAS